MTGSAAKGFAGRVQFTCPRINVVPRPVARVSHHVAAAARVADRCGRTLGAGAGVDLVHVIACFCPQLSVLIKSRS